MKTLRYLVLTSICAVASLVIFAACSEAGGPFEPANEPEQEIAGLVLLRDGKPIVAVDVDQVYGTVNIQMDQYSDIFEVEFYDENRAMIPNDSQTYKLAWRNDAEYAIFEQPDDLKEWEFHIRGKKPGNTAFELVLENGESVHYSSPSIALKVR